MLLCRLSRVSSFSLNWCDIRDLSWQHESRLHHQTQRRKKRRGIKPRSQCRQSIRKGESDCQRRSPWRHPFPCAINGLSNGERSDPGSESVKFALSLVGSDVTYVWCAFSLPFRYRIPCPVVSSAKEKRDPYSSQFPLIFINLAVWLTLGEDFFIHDLKATDSKVSLLSEWSRKGVDTRREWKASLSRLWRPFCSLLEMHPPLVSRRYSTIIIRFTF